MGPGMGGNLGRVSYADNLAVFSQPGQFFCNRMQCPAADAGIYFVKNQDGYFVGFSSGITTGVWMGRDDAKAVGGLQGGTAPARAFAAYMRFAVKDRPVEEFDTDLKLPQWQLEPDDEYLYGDPEEWYFIDEQGNLIEPRGSEGGSPLGPEEGGTTIQMVPPRMIPEPRQQPPAAASDDFLERATGGELPADPAPQRRQQPPPIQPPPRPTGPGQVQ